MWQLNYILHFYRIMLLRNNTLRIINSSRSDEGRKLHVPCGKPVRFSGVWRPCFWWKVKRPSSTPAPILSGPIPWLTTLEQTEHRLTEPDGRRVHYGLSGVKMFVLPAQESAHKSIYCLLGQLLLGGCSLPIKQIITRRHGNRLSDLINVTVCEYLLKAALETQNIC